MKIKVNRKTIEIFEGALVRHALLRYFAVKGLDVGLVDTLMQGDFRDAGKAVILFNAIDKFLNP